MNKSIRKYLLKQYWQYQNINFASRGNDIAQYFTLFTGKPKHNSGNDILGGNQDMLKDPGTYWTKFNKDDCMSSTLLNSFQYRKYFQLSAINSIWMMFWFFIIHMKIIVNVVFLS